MPNNATPRHKKINPNLDPQVLLARMRNFIDDVMTGFRSPKFPTPPLDGCQYITGDPGHTVYSYCGQRTVVPGASWCADHYPRMYQKEKVKTPHESESKPLARRIKLR